MADVRLKLVIRDVHVGNALAAFRASIPECPAVPLEAKDFIEDWLVKELQSTIKNGQEILARTTIDDTLVDGIEVDDT